MIYPFKWPTYLQDSPEWLTFYCTFCCFPIYSRQRLMIRTGAKVLSALHSKDYLLLCALLFEDFCLFLHLRCRDFRGSDYQSGLSYFRGKLSTLSIFEGKLESLGSTGLICWVVLWIVHLSQHSMKQRLRNHPVGSAPISALSHLSLGGLDSKTDIWEDGRGSVSLAKYALGISIQTSLLHLLFLTEPFFKKMASISREISSE